MLSDQNLKTSMEAKLQFILQQSSQQAKEAPKVPSSSKKGKLTRKEWIEKLRRLEDEQRQGLDPNEEIEL
jgi:hypothetical protein